MSFNPFFVGSGSGKFSGRQAIFDLSPQSQHLSKRAFLQRLPQASHLIGILPYNGLGLVIGAGVLFALLLSEALAFLPV